MTVLERLFGPRRPTAPEPGTGSIVAICHCHYPDLVPELVAALRWLPESTALYVTSSRPEVLDRWHRLDRAPRRETALYPTENRGRDIRPFFECAARLQLTDATLVLKIHGKKSGYSKQGDRWRRELLHGLLSGPTAVRDAAARFRGDRGLAMLGPRGSFISHPVYWGRNRAPVGRFMRQTCGVDPSDDDLGFFAGTMFWMRGEFLTKFSSHVDLEAFEPEPLHQDGTYAHMIERVMAMAARQMGFGLGEIGHEGRIEPQAVAARKIRFI